MGSLSFAVFVFFGGLWDQCIRPGYSKAHPRNKPQFVGKAPEGIAETTACPNESREVGLPGEACILECAPLPGEGQDE